MLMKYFEMFAGIGGFRYGIEQATDWHCIGYSEIEWIITIDKKTGKLKRERNRAPDIYRYHYPGHRNFGDATAIDITELPDFDLLVAGFPCQAFSIAGKREGFNDTRGTLFFEIARVLRDKRPGYFLLENVKGLLSHDDGKTFQTILRVLSDTGYRDIQWQVLNSKDFGVPQNRERVFIVGHLGGERRPEVFPLGEESSPSIQEEHEQCISGTLSTKNQSGQAQWDGSTTLVQKGIATAIDGNYYKGCDNHAQRTMIAVCDPGLHRQSQIRTKTMPPLRANIGAGHDNLIVQRPHGFNKGGTKELPCLRGSAMEQNEFMMVHNIYGGFGETKPRIFKDISPTIRTPKGGGHLPMVANKQSIRRLTPVECERLQGFPDGWTEYGIDENGKIVKISDTQRYKCLGNAVTTTVITAVISALRVQLCLN